MKTSLAEYTNKELSRLLDLTAGRVSQLAAQGKITRLPNGKFPASAIQEYVQFIRKQAEASNPISEELQREKLRKMKRENDAEDAKVAPVELLEYVLEQRACGIIVQQLGTIPDRIRQHWPEVTEAQLDLVRNTVDQCQEVARDMRIEAVK